MDLKQRKTHRIIWFVLTITITVFMFFSIRELHFNTHTSEKLITQTIPSNPNIKYNDLVEIEVLQNKTLSITLRKPLKSSFSLVYGRKKNGKEILLGQVFNSGKAHYFKLKESIVEIAIYDTLKQKEITKIKF